MKLEAQPRANQIYQAPSLESLRTEDLARTDASEVKGRTVEHKLPV